MTQLRSFITLTHSAQNKWAGEREGMRTIAIDLNLALEYTQAEIGRLMSGRSSPSSMEILDRIRAQAQVTVEKLPDTDLRYLVLADAFRRIEAS